MILKSLTLSHFRSFDSSTLYFSPMLSVVIGKNSVGKTNLLESISLVLTGKGVKEENVLEFIAFDKRRATVSATLGDENNKLDLRVTIKKNDLGIDKIFQINKIVKRLFEYSQTTPPVVLFTPQQIKIIDGAPAKRRDYIDMVLCRVDRLYAKRLGNYNQGLRKRNKVLEQKKPPELIRQELIFWDNFLIEQAEYISEKRQALIDFYNLEASINNHKFIARYLKNEMSSDSLERTFEKSLYTRRTMVGPQKDDIEITLTEKEKSINVHIYGSRSQQRLALFWLAVRQLAYYQENIEIKPLLLLDDVFSELDMLNKAIIFTMINKYQTILTTTEHEVIELITLPHVVINL